MRSGHDGTVWERTQRQPHSHRRVTVETDGSVWVRNMAGKGSTVIFTVDEWAQVVAAVAKEQAITAAQANLAHEDPPPGIGLPVREGK